MMPPLYIPAPSRLRTIALRAGDGLQRFLAGRLIVWLLAVIASGAIWAVAIAIAWRQF